MFFKESLIFNGSFVLNSLPNRYNNKKRNWTLLPFVGLSGIG
jgi:hypothetical protein